VKRFAPELVLWRLGISDAEVDEALAYDIGDEPGDRIVHYTRPKSWYGRGEVLALLFFLKQRDPALSLDDLFNGPVEHGRAAMKAACQRREASKALRAMFDRPRTPHHAKQQRAMRAAAAGSVAAMRLLPLFDSAHAHEKVNPQWPPGIDAFA